MIDFQGTGRRLLANGYLIVPIKAGHKRPALDQWQHARLGASDLTRYDGCGIGVLTGQGAHPLCAFDVDTLDAALAAAFVAWCSEHLGATVERVGKAPKTLLVYRAAKAGWGKRTGRWYVDAAGVKQRLEVLGRGQQFVAYHTHPETGRPYEWVDLVGGLETLRADELPVVSEDDVTAALAAFERLADAHGLTATSPTPARSARAAPGGDALMAYEPPIGVALDEARRLLDALPADDYDTWLRAGMSLHHEYAASAEALDLWDTWSAQASNYAGREDIEFRWASFGNDPGRTPTTIRWLLKFGREATRDVERQGKRDALAEAKREIELCTDSLVLLSELAPRFGELAGNDVAVRTELVGLLRAQFKALTQTPLSVTEARKALEGGQQQPTAVLRQLSEFGNTERMLDHYGRGLMYVPELAAWYRWTGVHWQRAMGVEIEHLAKETIKALPAELDEMDGDAQREAFLKFCAASQRDYMVKSMVNLARSDPHVVVPVRELDRRLYLLGVANGAVDLRTGQLLPPTQEQRITLVSPVEYDAEARAPLWEQTVSDVFYGKTEEIAFFQRFIGYCLLGKPDEDILAIPYGTGSNGKSTVLGAIRDVLGDYARTAKAETFLTSGYGTPNAAAPREDVLRLRGSRFVYITEPEEGAELREGFIKSMTGGEALPARGIHAKTTVEVVPTWVGVMPTNHKPIVKGDDHGIWRRLLLIPFTRNFDSDPDVTKDVAREQRLKAEAPGILRWCVEGAIRYAEQGLAAPQPVRDARERYRGEMDLLGDWLDACCELDPAASETNARLWASWEAYARAHGELRLIPSSRALGRRLAARFEAMRTKKGRGFRGLRLVAISDFLRVDEPESDLV